MNEYEVWCPERGAGAEDAVTVRALHEEQAAEVWAKCEDAESAEYWIAFGDGAVVHVRRPGGATIELRVTGEQTISYIARPVRKT